MQEKLIAIYATLVALVAHTLSILLRQQAIWRSSVHQSIRTSSIKLFYTCFALSLTTVSLTLVPGVTKTAAQKLQFHIKERFSTVIASSVIPQVTSEGNLNVETNMTESLTSLARKKRRIWRSERCHTRHNIIESKQGQCTRHQGAPLIRARVSVNNV